MKKLVIGIAVVIILALNVAALDDITTGNEPDKTLEWAIVIGSAMLFMVTIVTKMRKQKKENVKL